MFDPIEKSSSYFVVGSLIIEGENKSFTPREIKEKVLKHLNADPARKKKHSVHLLHCDRDKNPVAAKCKCGSGVSHPIVIGAVLWETPLNEQQVRELKKGELTFLY